MRPLRLETFAPNAAPGPGRADAMQQLVEAARDQGFQAGYLAGQATATEAHAEDDRRITSDLVEAVADQALTNEAARAAVLAGISPLVGRLFAALAPALAEGALVPEIARRVEDALRRIPDAEPRIRCAPEVAPAVEAALSARRLTARVEAAPTLLPREAEIAWDNGFDHIDLDRCIADIRGCIASHLNLDGEGQE